MTNFAAVKFGMEALDALDMPLAKKYNKLIIN